MSKWSIFFLLVPIFGVGIFVAAPEFGWSLPPNVSVFGAQIDQLYYGILVITGVTFIGTNLALVYVLWRFGDPKPGGKAVYTHGSRNLEVLWTVIPAIVLLFIALYQMPAWIEVRFPSSKPKIEPIAAVVARQFEWRMVYPGYDGKLDSMDDVHVVNELHIVKNQRTLIDLRSMDVLHSFFLPHMRVKQDAVPGLRIPVWFEPTKSTAEFQAERCDFSESDLVDVEGLALKLQKNADPVSTALMKLLNSDVRKEILGYNGEESKFEPEIVAEICKDLNGIIAENDLFATKAFDAVKLTEETKTLLETKPRGDARKLLNRLLLADAFPNHVKTVQKHYELVCAELCGWGHYKMKGRVVVHDTREEYNAWLERRTAEQEASK